MNLLFKIMKSPTLMVKVQLNCCRNHSIISIPTRQVANCIKGKYIDVTAFIYNLNLLKSLNND